MNDSTRKVTSDGQSRRHPIEQKKRELERHNQRIRLRYPELFPLPPISAVEVTGIRSQLTDVNFCKGVIVCYPKDWRKTVFLWGLHKVGLDVRLGSFTAYEFVQDHFKKGEDAKIDLDPFHILAIGLGYPAPSNRTLPEILGHIMVMAANKGILRQEGVPELPKWSGQAIWIYYKGTKRSFVKSYSQLADLAKEFDYCVIELKDPRSLSNDA